MRESSIRYSKVLARRVCDLIESKMTITEICKKIEMPDRRTIHRWRHKYPDFDERLIRSERIRLSFLVDEMIELTNEDMLVYLLDKNKRIPTRIEVYAESSRRRLRVDTIKFLSAKLYGTKSYEIEQQHIDKVIQVVNYQSNDRSINENQKKFIPDLQPKELKYTPVLTPAQQAQVDSIKQR